MKSSSTRKYLVVKGCAGIGNRLFTLAAALRYAERTGRKTVVDWNDGVFAEPGKNAFDLIFELADKATMTEIETHKNELSYYPRSLKKHLTDNLYRAYRPAASAFFKKFPVGRLNGRASRLNEYWKFIPGDNFGQVSRSDLQAIGSIFSKDDVEYGHKLSASQKEDVVMFADYWPGDVPREYFDKIRVSAAFLEKVQGLKAQLGLTPDTVGVHVRYTDKKPGRAVESLVQELSRVPGNRKIFLATDNPEIETLFRKSFSHRIIVQPKYYPDDNFNMHHAALKSGNYEQAQRVYTESMTDVLLLGNCSTFFFQGNSSFSRLALKYSTVPQETIDWLKL